MGALRFPGFGERLRVALIAAGYVRPSGKPDVPAFIAQHGYDPRGFYPWLRGVRTPELDTLTRLAEALNVSRAWLLLGDGAGPQPPRPRGRKPVSVEPHPIGGGVSNTGVLPLASLAEVLPLIGHWWPLRWGWLGGPAGDWCPA